MDDSLDIDFSSPGDAKEEIEDALRRDPKHVDMDELDIRDDKPLVDLNNAVVVLKDIVSWTKNMEMTNKAQEASKFQEAWKNDKKYDPSFEYSSPDVNPRTAIKFLSGLNRECTRIDKITLKELGAEKLEVEDIRNLFRGTFEEYKLYIKIAATLENTDSWRSNCLKLWPMNEESALNSKKKLVNNDFQTEDEEKTLNAAEIKQMWTRELERMGVDYRVKTRNVSGCFNIPEEQTVVVASGRDEERLYSRSEARMLTVHELFHVVRSYNGREVAEESGFPPILGIHTPFYDKTEEGGAVYREIKTDVMTSAKKKDYHLRNMAAYYTKQGLEFPVIVNKLVKLGAKPTRAFGLAARNREVLRHHIYLEGYQQDWKNQDELWPLLMGKINAEWANKLKKEVEAEDGMLERPPVMPEDLFNHPGLD